ncbi:HNH endonuclease [Bdellovibrio sp. HCB274]|uniref:HNH endonuclease n=1 Tax=Bdellovibrio sp. HCB274 TaxID=3394361 RepID=UPI0039B3C27A
MDLGFGSLFDYLVKGVGYSEGSAQRRIDAARLIREVPALATKIQNGELKLNQVSLVQKAAREVFKTNKIKVSAKQKLEVINDLCGKNHSESQQQVAAFFDLPVLHSTLQKVQADESVRIELTLSKETFAKIKHAQELLSHSVSSNDLGKFLEYLSEKVIKQKASPSKSSVQPTSVKESTATVAVATPKPVIAKSAARVMNNSKSQSRMAISAKAVTRPAMSDIRKIRFGQKTCQYIDLDSGRHCDSTWLMQIDHKHSQWAGGGHQMENLQILCAGHNQLKYRNENGIKLKQLPIKL